MMCDNDEDKAWRLCRFDEDQDLDEGDGKVVAATIVACATLGVLLILLVAGALMK